MKKKSKSKSEPEMHRAGEGVSRRTLRLTFEYQGDQIRLVNRLRVEKITPPSLTTCPNPDKASGYWVELHDASGRCLFHRLLPDAIRQSAEIYPDRRSLSRTTLREFRGRFEVLLPDLPEGNSVVVMGHPISIHGIQGGKACCLLAEFRIDGDEGRDQK